MTGTAWTAQHTPTARPSLRHALLTASDNVVTHGSAIRARVGGGDQQQTRDQARPPPPHAVCSRLQAGVQRLPLTDLRAGPPKTPHARPTTCNYQQAGVGWPLEPILAFQSMKALALPYELHPAFEDSWYP